MTGGFMNWTDGSQCQMWRSVPQIPVALTWITTSPAAGVGRGRSVTSIAPSFGAVFTTAFMVATASSRSVRGSAAGRRRIPLVRELRRRRVHQIRDAGAQRLGADVQDVPRGDAVRAA